MDYMGFHDLFDHLLDWKKTQNEPADAALVSSSPDRRSSKQPRRAKNRRNAVSQCCRNNTTILHGDDR